MAKLTKSLISKKIKAILPSIVGGKVTIENDIVSLELKWKNFPRTVKQHNVLHHRLSEAGNIQELQNLVMKQIETIAQERILNFGKRECDYLMDKIGLRDIYRKEFEDKNLMYKARYRYDRKIGQITIAKSLDFHYYDEIKLALPYFYTLWILQVRQNFTHSYFDEIMEVTESLIMHFKQLFFTKQMIEDILRETKHFGNPDSFFVFYYHFIYFLSLIKTIGDNLSWMLTLYLKLNLHHRNIELDSIKFKKAIQKFQHYYNTIYHHEYYTDFIKINEFRNVSQHRHIIRSMRVVLQSTLKNKILIPKDPDVQISKKLRVVNKFPKNMHVKLAENRDATLQMGPHDYTLIRDVDLSDYEDPVTFCNTHTAGIIAFAESILGRIVHDLTRKKIGIVSNYYSRKSVAQVTLSGELKCDSYLLIEGSTTSIKQAINEFRMNDIITQSANSGEATIKLNERARVNDVVYRIPRINKKTYEKYLF